MTVFWLWMCLTCFCAGYIGGVIMSLKLKPIKDEEQG